MRPIWDEYSGVEWAIISLMLGYVAKLGLNTVDTPAEAIRNPVYAQSVATPRGA